MDFCDLQASLAAALPGHVVKGFRIGDRVRISLEGVTATGTILPWYPASITQDHKVCLDGTGQDVFISEGLMTKI